MLNKYFCSFMNPKLGFKPSTPPSSVPLLSSITCSQECIQQLLSTMKTKTASGPDNISSHMLKNTARSISPFLHELFSLSLSTGKLPSEWKISNVTPIPKSGDASQCCNYRPISLLSIVSKTFERIIHNQLLNFLLKHSRISRFQFGFRPNSSTQEALLHLSNEWHQQLDSGNQVAAIFFDLSKAFDTVPHDLLLESLQRVGVSGSLLTWFEDYLSGRLQRVVLDGHTSAALPVTSGVPQGSILGPLLFIIFMNSIFDTVLSGGSRIILYADDMVLYKPIKNNQDLLDFQNDIDAICSWTSTNSLHLNATKTKSILITRKKHRPILNFVIGSYPIPSVTSLKFLGVVITDNLSWSSHIESTCLKAKKELRLIHRHYHQAPRVARERLYKLRFSHTLTTVQVFGIPTKQSTRRN